jgi:two-component system, chemotaxis family, chemotaxis protein CheY
MSDRPMHFLVVDDDDSSRSTIVEYLRSMGHDRISQARDGGEALRMLERDSSITFIISDWEMPTMNGLALLQQVRSHSSRSNLPFLITTSPIAQESEKIILAAESYVDAYVIKPFRLDTLKEKIAKILEVAVHGPQKTVLVADDDEDARSTVIEYLKKLGYKEVQGFSSAKQALEDLKKNSSKYGLIVSDWEMPEMTGLEFLKNCRSDESLAKIPFLMVTSQSSMERMKIMQAAKERVDHYLLKPFRFDELKNRVEGILNRSQSSGQVEALLAQGNLELVSGKFQQAEKSFQRVLAVDSDNDVALRGLGDASITTRGIESAMGFYKRAVEINPMSAQGYIKLANAYEQVGLAEKAIALLQTANETVGFNAELHFALGKLYSKKGMVELARSEFEKTLQIQLDHSEAHVLLENLKERG